MFVYTDSKNLRQKRLPQAMKKMAASSHRLFWASDLSAKCELLADTLKLAKIQPQSIKFPTFIG